MSTPALNPLVEKIRTAHPGAYDDLDDAELTKRVLNKYPQYSDLAAPPVPDPRKQVDVQPSLLGDSPALETQAPRQNTQEDFPGFEGSYAANDPAKGAVISGAGILGAGALATPATLGVLGKLATKYPRTAAILGSSAIGEARKIPYVGDLIPSYAEMLPFILGGGKGVPEAETTKIPPADVYRSGYRAPRAYYGGQPPEPIPPRSGLMLGEGKGVPKAETTKIPPADVYRSGYRAPRAYYGGQPPESIPSRSGLMLGGKIQPPIEGEYVQPKTTPTTEPPYAPGEVLPQEPAILRAQPKPAGRISKDEWNAAHSIESEIEGSPKSAPAPEQPATSGATPAQKTAQFLKTSRGRRLTKIYQDTVKEHASGQIPGMEEEAEEQNLPPRKPPEGTVTPQTSEEMEDALKRSLARIRK